MRRSDSTLRLLLWAVLCLLATALGACRAPKNFTNIPIPPGFNDLPNNGGGGGGGGGRTIPVNLTGVSVQAVGGGTIDAGDDIIITVSWTGDIDPWVLGYVFTPGTVDPASLPAMPRTAATSPDSITVSTLPTSEGTTCTVTVGIADDNLNVDSATQTFSVEDAVVVPVNNDPVITAVANDADGTIQVSATDADGDDIAVTQVVPAALTALDGDQSFAAGNGSFTFGYVATDILAGGSGNVTFTADDGNGGTDTIAANLLLAGITLVVDTLYAIPTRETVAVGAPLTILVATGLPFNNFEYMNGVRVTASNASGFDYVDNSFNVGAIGGNAADADGVWADMTLGGFLLPPDDFIMQAVGNNNTFALDFNITPLTGSEINPIGALFNFQATFTTPGTYQLGFEQLNIVSRTYYQDDSQGQEFFWADITNDHAGVDNSVTVVP